MYSKIIDKYINEHKSNYQAKYVYHSCDRIDARTFKFHYYIRDRQLLQMNIFMEIHLGDEVEVSMREQLYEHEQWALACDALERIRTYTNRRTSIAVNDMESFIENKSIKSSLTPQDMINTLNYIMYHEGKNPDSIYSFYEIFIPYLQKRLSEKKYKEVLLSCNLLLDDILQETIWQGFNIKYLDQEHVLHHAYMHSVLSMIHEDFDLLETSEHDLLLDFMLKIFKHWRFALAIYSSLEKITRDYPNQMMRFLSEMNESCHELSLDGCCLVYDIIFAQATNDTVGHRHSIIEILKLLMTDILSLANPEDQKDTGLIFLKMTGFDLLLEIFEQTKDSYVYSCFSIEEIPEDFHPYIKRQLEEALKSYAPMIKNPKKRMEALDQIATINTLLIEHFSEY